MSATLPAMQPSLTLDPLDFHKVAREIGALLPSSAQFPRLSHHVYEESASVGGTLAVPHAETIAQRLVQEAIRVSCEDSTSDSSTSEPSRGEGT
jgi:hypothetical protein